MKVINNYIFILTLKYICVSAFIIVGLDVLFNIVFSNTDLFSIDGYTELVVYFISLVLDRTYMYASVYIYIAILMCLARLSVNSELLVIKSVGMNFWGIVYLFFRPVCIIIIVLVCIGEFVIPYTVFLSSKYVSNDTLQRNVLYKEKDSAVYISKVTNAGHLDSFIEYQFNNNELHKITAASTGQYTKDKWVLSDVSTRYYYPEKLSVQRDKLSVWNSSLSVRSLFAMSADIESLSLPDLYYYIVNNSRLSFYSKNYEVIFWNKIFFPVVILCLVILAISCVYNFKSRQSMYKKLSISIAVGIVLQYMQLIVGPVTIVYNLPTILTAIIPIGFILAVSWCMFYKMR